MSRERANMAIASEVVVKSRGAASQPSPSHVVEDQEEVFRFLASPAAQGRVEGVKRIDTHGAVVFLAGRHAYKVKRAVRFPYMDYSTVEKRRQACEAEIAVNRAGAPSIYLGVLPIVRRDAALHLGGEGDVVEWVVHMRRFDEEMTLDRVAVREGLSPGLVAEIAAAVARSHAGAPIRRGVDFAAALERLIDENGASLGEAGVVFERSRVAALTARSRRALDAVESLLRGRAAAGQVRRCHGDLHLRNLVLLDGRPTLFDAIEFDEALATTDILYDLAFLLMDVAERGLRFEANLLLNRYLVECADDRQFAGLAALPLFISVRAAIRAKVIAAGLDHLAAREQSRSADDARRYLAFAETALAPVAPQLIAVGGLSGTGKSTLSSRLAALAGQLPGAIHLRSDVVRKQLLRAREFERLPPTAYDSAATDAVYGELRRQAETVLRAGYAVIVDAVHQRPEEREAIGRLAALLGVKFTGLWLEAPVKTLIARVSARTRDASDADAGIVTAQASRASGEIEWRRVDASGDAETTLARAAAIVAAPTDQGGRGP
jgi:aminoglycoside phosphotransferase family enzyme/predicted kinase